MTIYNGHIQREDASVHMENKQIAPSGGKMGKLLYRWLYI